MKPFTICPDCGENIGEFMLHKEGCPQFGKEIQEFMEAHDAEIATWPAKAREQLDRLNTMHSFLFGKLLRTQRLLDQAKAVLERSKAENLGHRCSDGWFIARDKALAEIKNRENR